ncbi:ATP-binding cassette domain-containing protein [bacterium]|nr:ATP-binding cassette domain-containing protein [bacterium]
MDALLTAAFTKAYPGFELAFDLSLAPGITALMGPSGSGKTTAIRCLAGLVRPETGLVRWGEECWQDSAQGSFLSVQQRRIGFVFKEFALFPHMTVWENVRYGAKRDAWAKELLELLAIDALRDRRPPQLSAGQQQRVAIARAIASEPRLLLMDEPFSSLDPPLKRHLLAEFASLVRRIGLPTLVVTHALDEASVLADDLVVMAAGRVLQKAPVREVMTTPSSPEVARLVGIRNCFEASADVAAWCVRADRIVLANPADEGAIRLMVKEAVLEEGGLRILGTGGVFEALEVRLPLSACEGRAIGPGASLDLRIPPEAVHRFEGMR